MPRGALILIGASLLLEPARVPLSLHLLMLLLTCGGMALSAGLLISTLGGSGLPGCGADSGCQALHRSRWARIRRLPVAALALLGYLLLLILLLVGLAVPRVHNVVLLLVSALAGAALWYLALQVALRQFCRYCVALHAVSLILAALLAWTLQRSAAGGWVGWGYPGGFIAAGLAAAGLLALLQVLLPPASFAVVPATALPDAAQNSPEPSADHVLLLGGKVRLDRRDWPLLGDPAAQRVLAVFFDVTCPECRQLHSLLPAALALQPVPTAMLLLPVPLDPACNPAVTQPPVHPESPCELARLALAVWVAAPDDFGDFAHWLLTGPRVPGLLAVRQRAEKVLGGAVKLLLAKNDPRSTALLQQSIALSTRLGLRDWPQILLENQLVLGRLASTRELAQVLAG